MDTAGLLIVLSLVAGVVGTGAGGVVGALFGNKNGKTMGRLLSFAGGVMVGVVCFELIPESLELTKRSFFGSSVLFMILSVLVGVVGIYLLNKLVDWITDKSASKKTHVQLEELHHESGLIEATKAKEREKERQDGEESSADEIIPLNEEVAKADASRRSLLKAGILMLLAIALHNFPEGMAIGATGVHSENTGVLMAVIIALHNIPEGMAIAAPMVGGGVKKWLTILLTALAGAATILGAGFGILLGGISDFATGMSIGAAGGAMLYVTFGEIMPQSILMEEGRVPAVSMLVGLLSSTVIVFLF